MGDFSESLNIRIVALEEWRDHNAQLPQDYPQLLTTKLNLARSYKRKQQWEDAIRYYDEVYLSKLQSTQLYHPRHCRYASNNGLRLYPRKENALLCADTHMDYGIDIAIEALEGKACVQYRLKQQEAASRISILVKKI